MGSTTATAAPVALNALNPRQLARFLSKMIPARKPVLIGGAPGIGKTDIVTQAALAAGADLLVWHPVTSDPTDFKGLPFYDAAQNTAAFKPYDKLARLRDATRLTVVLLDDLAHALPATMSAAMHLILAREIDGVRISDSVVFIACTNRSSDMAGTNAIIEPLKSRFATIVELVIDKVSWVEWAKRNGIAIKTIAYIDKYGEASLNNFLPSKQLTNSPSPRAWSHVSDHEVLFDGDDELKWPAIHGAIGDTEATKYRTFSDLYDILPDVKNIIANPKTAPIPVRIDERYATASALANVANLKTIDAIVTYCERLHDAGQGDYGVLTLRDASLRDKALLTTGAWQKVATGKLAPLFAGKAA